MSMAIKVAKAQAGVPSAIDFRGDPGLFGFIGKTIGKVAGIAGKFLPGPVGAIAGTIAGTIAGRGAGQVPTSLPVARDAFTISRLQQQQRCPPGSTMILGKCVNIGGAFPGGDPLFPARVAANGAMVAPSGFHLNKSDYFLRDGTFIPAGTRLVKNRRRNPNNPRANSRALARITSAKKAQKALESVTIKCRRCFKVSCECRR